jgi:hypothetical protein
MATHRNTIWEKWGNQMMDELSFQIGELPSVPWRSCWRKECSFPQIWRLTLSGEKSHFLPQTSRYHCRSQSKMPEERVYCNKALSSQACQLKWCSTHCLIINGHLTNIAFGSCRPKSSRQNMCQWHFPDLPTEVAPAARRSLPGLGVPSRVQGWLFNSNYPTTVLRTGQDPLVETVLLPDFSKNLAIFHHPWLKCAPGPPARLKVDTLWVVRRFMYLISTARKIREQGWEFWIDGMQVLLQLVFSIQDSMHSLPIIS